MTKKKTTREPEKQPTCNDRIDGQLEGRLRDIELLFAVIDRELDKHTEDPAELAEYSEMREDEAYERIQEMPLCADIRTTIVIQLSTGGPGDQFECDVTKEKYGWSIDEIRYRFLDWFDGAARHLTGPEYDLAKRFCEQHIEGLE